MVVRQPLQPTIQPIGKFATFKVVLGRGPPLIGGVRLDDFSNNTFKRLMGFYGELLFRMKNTLGGLGFT